MSRTRERALVLACVACVACVAAGCTQEMRDQARIEPYEAVDGFFDRSGARDLPDGVVPRGGARLDRHLWEGRGPDGEEVDTYPFPITAADLRRGAERYRIHCEPCHGRLGEGDGMVVRRGYPAPPAFTAARVRDEPPGEIFMTITGGEAQMPDYDHIPVADRWRITAWVEVLRRSQRAPRELLRPDERDRLAEVRR